MGHLSAPRELHKRWVHLLQQEFYCQVRCPVPTGYALILSGWCLIWIRRRDPFLLYTALYVCPLSGRCGKGVQAACLAPNGPYKAWNNHISGAVPETMLLTVCIVALSDHLFFVVRSGGILRGGGVSPVQKSGDGV